MLMSGREIDFLIHAGIPSDVANNRKHQKCSCGGKDRLRITNTGQFFCNQHGNGDYFALLEHFFGTTFIEGIKLAKDYLGISNLTDRQRLKIEEKARKLSALNYARSKVKEDNLKLDSEVKWCIDNVEIFANERKPHDLPCDAELKSYDELIMALVSRQEKIFVKRDWYEKQKRLSK